MLADRATRGAVARRDAGARRAAGGAAAALRAARRGAGARHAARGAAPLAPGWPLRMERRRTARAQRARAVRACCELADLRAAEGDRRRRRLAAGGARGLARRRCWRRRRWWPSRRDPSCMLVGAWRDWGEGMLAWRRLAGLVRRGAPPRTSRRAMPQAPPGLVVEGLTVCARRARTASLVRDLDIAPRRRAGRWAVPGRTASARPACCAPLLGLAAPAAGRVLLDGQDTLRATARATRRRGIGYLPQEAQLLEGSVLDNIAPLRRRRRRGGGGGRARASARMRRSAGCRAATRTRPAPGRAVGRPGSGSSRWRARLHGAPRLVVLDEPEAGLDGAARAGMRAGVAAARAQGAVRAAGLARPRGLARHGGRRAAARRAAAAWTLEDDGMSARRGRAGGGLRRGACRRRALRPAAWPSRSRCWSLGVGGLVGWAAVTPIERAVIGQGTLVAEGRRKIGHAARTRHPARIAGARGRARGGRASRCCGSTPPRPMPPPRRRARVFWGQSVRAARLIAEQQESRRMVLPEGAGAAGRGRSGASPR